MYKLLAHIWQSINDGYNYNYYYILFYFSPKSEVLASTLPSFMGKFNFWNLIFNKYFLFYNLNAVQCF